MSVIAPGVPVNHAALFVVPTTSPPDRALWKMTRPCRLMPVIWAVGGLMLPLYTAPAVPGAGSPSRATRTRPPGGPAKSAVSLVVVTPAPASELPQKVRPSGLILYWFAGPAAVAVLSVSPGRPGAGSWLRINIARLAAVVPV